MTAQVICPYCGQPAQLVEKKIIEGPAYGKIRMVWMCKPCKAWVGCHPGTIVPLGTLANAELRRWRTKAHDTMDLIWKNGEMKRPEFYAMLERAFKRKIHIGQADIETCKQVIEFANAFINWRTK